MNTLTVSLFYLMIPGVLMALIYDTHTQHKPWDSFRYILMSIVFGVITYLTMQAIISIYQLAIGINDTKSIDWTVLSIWSIADQSDKIKTNPLEVLSGSVTALILGLFAVYLNKKRTFHNFLLRKGISNKYGDDNVFIRTIEDMTKDECNAYILLADENLLIHGQIKYYNESEKTQEVSLEQVSVFRAETGDIMLMTNSLYVSKEFGKLIIFKNNLDIPEDDN